MAERSEHKFQFKASTIAEAANRRAKYHGDRVTYWTKEFDDSVKKVKETARIEVKTVDVTGGQRADIGIQYGDPLAYRRMNESDSKLREHRQQQQSFETDALVYSTQGDRVYELDMTDVLHYHLGDLISENGSNQSKN